MLEFLSSMLCTSKIHSFLLGNYLGISLIVRNFMRIRVPSVEWTWLGLEWPPTQYAVLYTGDIISLVP